MSQKKAREARDNEKKVSKQIFLSLCVAKAFCILYHNQGSDRVYTLEELAHEVTGYYASKGEFDQDLEEVYACIVRIFEDAANLR